MTSSDRLVRPSEVPRRRSVLDAGLGHELRRCRERAGLSSAEAAAAGGLITAALDEVERGASAVPESVVADLLTRYGVAGERRSELLTLTRRAVDHGWWHGYADLLLRVHDTYLRLEAAASMVRTYDREVVPKLLQTREYACAVLRTAATALGMTRVEDVERMVDLRTHRQRLLLAEGGPSCWAVVDEAVLRSIEDRELRRAQLTHLLEVGERSGVSLQVVPANAAGHLPVAVSFTLLRFAQQYLPDVAYVEQTTRPLYLERRADVEHYTLMMERLVARIPSPSRTAAILDRLRSEG
jgi:transcriptional regulator with XRE-family HTH domain